MHLSEELQFGKAGEHLVCADLLLQGHAAYLTDQGLPYDVIADMGHAVCRIQVKATTPKEVQGRIVYPFTIRRAKGGTRAVDSYEADCFAFVALDVRKIAYLPSWEILSGNGPYVVQGIHFRAAHLGQGERRHNPPGHGNAIRMIEDYEIFPFG